MIGNARSWRLFVLVILLQFLCAAAATAFGAIDLTWRETLAGLSGPQDTQSYMILWNLRLPRVVLGAMVGGHFTLAGAILQVTLRNPLVDAGILGVSSGAGLAVVSAMLFLPAGTIAAIPIVAFAGGLAAALAVFHTARDGGIEPARLILSGIALASFCTALTTGVLVAWGNSRTEGILLWLTGSLYGRDWQHVGLLWPWSILLLTTAPLLVSPLSVLRLGPAAAQGVGLNIRLWRIMLMTYAVLAAASAVAVAGPVGFIGLIVPHMARMMAGNRLILYLPLSAILGANLVLLADLTGRTLFLPVELPVGVLTSLLGVPFFLFLLYRSRHQEAL